MMLNNEEKEKLKENTSEIDIEEVIKETKKMGIEITENRNGFHGIYNKDGVLEEIDIDKVFEAMEDSGGDSGKWLKLLLFMQDSKYAVIHATNLMMTIYDPTEYKGLFYVYFKY